MAKKLPSEQTAQEVQREVERSRDRLRQADREAEAMRFVNAANRAAGKNVSVVGKSFALVNLTDMFNEIFDQVAALLDSDLVLRRKLPDFLKAQGYSAKDVEKYGGTFNMAARLIPSRYPDANALAEAIRATLSRPE